MSDVVDDLWRAAQELSSIPQSEVMYRAVSEIKAERKMNSEDIQRLEDENAALKEKLAAAELSRSGLRAQLVISHEYVLAFIDSMKFVDGDEADYRVRVARDVVDQNNKLIKG